MSLTGRAVLVQAIAGQRRDVLLSSLMITGHQAGEALVPFVIGVVIDQAVGGGTGALALWLGVLGVVYVGLSFSYRFGDRAAERASEQAAHGLRLALTRRVLDHGGGAETGRLPGALVNIATGDAGRVGAVNLVVPAGISACAGIALTAILLLLISLPLGLLVLLGTPPLLWLSHLLGKPLEHRSEIEQEHAARASGVATDLVSGIRVLKGLGAEGNALRRYRRTSQESLRATVKAARAEAGYHGIMIALNGVFLALIALVGGRLAADGHITIGRLVSTAGLAQYLLTPLGTFSWVNGEFAQGRASARRIAAILSAPPAVTPGPLCVPCPAAGKIALRGLSGPGLRGIDLDIAPGEFVGVVTTDPATATALLAYLGRAADPEEGSVELDGVPLSGLDPGELRAAILVASHDARLFDGTVRANLTASPGTDLVPALAAAGADEVVSTLPDGLDTLLDERGRSLSGGQRQRLALARALAADPPVLVVHDPTTAVDTVTEAGIAEGVRALRRDRTTILVTTSPALLAATDRVVLLHEGTITAHGDHASLVAEHPLYRTAVLS
ncbi:ABC transporter ATP-binding protein [Actinoallomurus bryophytorum]|uniref:Putative ABC transport system ATP-binding protein n=1 Tax=Actinoallomurus bryophytorum TaxID=1490222 RepID=A0A543BTN7_9ACTN|nr:ABC transporter ATP-binding protein [Actinoallomurus bryophytorum]TQL88187.1 putative ABC transport system ATP-binding protein [Actinoallomurus bryophytorum]